MMIVTSILGLALAACAAQDAAVVVEIDAGRVVHRLSPLLRGACIEDVNHEIYGGLYSQMIFGESFQEPPRPAAKSQHPDPSLRNVSGMWSAIQRGSARGEITIETHAPFVGRQCQRLVFREGAGAIGIENQGLNRWGLSLVAGKPYQGRLWARGPDAAVLTLRFESRDGARELAKTILTTQAGDWSKYEFTLTPTDSDPAGRFAITLDQPGSITLGHVFLEPGPWGRYKGLPVRKDVAQGLVDMGATVLRYGGSMINHPGYRWKEMIGPRDRRPTHAGTWYPYSSNGWGVLDFLNFCEAAGFVAIPALNMGESPQDMADFIAYVNGPADSPWGRKRSADGHPDPYHLKYVELGNEEAVDDAYWHRFQPMAEAIWAQDPAVVPVVGDFAYAKVIKDPYRFDGGARVNTLAAHRKILEFAKTKGREVWFDIHVGTDHPPEPHGLLSEQRYIEQLGKIAPGAKYKVVIFEYNSGNHAQKRALSNALATNLVERVGDLLPIACSANGLQPDGQNDNGWDQGLLFLNPAKVWLQPPGYLVQLLTRHHQPLLVKCAIKGRADRLSVSAKRSDDGKTLVLQAVNWADAPQPARIQIQGFVPSRPSATVEQLAGPLDAVNTAAAPERIKPVRSEWSHQMSRGAARYEFAPRSITFLRFE